VFCAVASHCVTMSMMAWARAQALTLDVLRQSGGIIAGAGMSQYYSTPSVSAIFAQHRSTTEGLYLELHPTPLASGPVMREAERWLSFQVLSAECVRTACGNPVLHCMNLSYVYMHHFSVAYSGLSLSYAKLTSR